MEAADERNALILAVPELRAAFADFLITSMREMVGLIGERAGRAPDDPEVIAVGGALMGVVLSSFLIRGQSLPEKLSSLDQQLGHLEAGFSV